jgi:hypothetical protein
MASGAVPTLLTWCANTNTDFDLRSFSLSVLVNIAHSSDLNRLALLEMNLLTGIIPALADEKLYPTGIRLLANMAQSSNELTAAFEKVNSLVPTFVSGLLAFIMTNVGKFFEGPKNPQEGGFSEEEKEEKSQLESLLEFSAFFLTRALLSVEGDWIQELVTQRDDITLALSDLWERTVPSDLSPHAGECLVAMAKKETHNDAMVKAGLLKAVERILRGNPVDPMAGRNDAQTEQAAQLLALLPLNDKVMQESVDKVLNLMELTLPLKEVEGTHRWVLMGLGNLCRSDANVEATLARGWAPRVVGLIAQHEEVVMARVSMGVVANIGRRPMGARALLEAGLMPPLVHRMRHKDAMTQMKASEALAIICRHDFMEAPLLAAIMSELGDGEPTHAMATLLLMCVQRMASVREALTTNTAYRQQLEAAKEAPGVANDLKMILEACLRKSENGMKKETEKEAAAAGAAGEDDKRGGHGEEKA